MTSKPIRMVLAALVLLAVPCLPTAAQTPTAAPPATAPSEDPARLFQAFAEDAAIVKGQWWEGQFDFSSRDLPGGSLDVTSANLVAAFQPFRDLEVGGRVGFGTTSADGVLPDGSGATDADVWGKWRFGGGGPADFAVGVLATVPTGDDQAGLGFDSFAIEAFGAMRYELRALTVGGHLGFRMNGDGQVQGFTLDGKTSAVLGGTVIYPFAKGASLIGELNLETERWEGADSDIRALGGIEWRVTRRGLVRGAVSVGLSDGAPDRRFLAGYAYAF